MIIDTIVGYIIMSFIIEYMDRKNFHFTMRDSIIAMLVAIFNFIVCTNALRFDWAYAEDNNKILDFIVFMWTTLVMILFTMHYKNSSRKIQKDHL